MIKRFCTFLGKFRRNREGSMILETALTLPILMLSFFGAVETGRYVILHQKLDRAAVTIADLVARADKLTTAQINDIFAATAPIVEPFDIKTGGKVIISSVLKTPNNPAKVVWQRTGSGTMTATSRIGVTNGNATFPTGFTLRDNESVIVTEVFYHFTPMLFVHMTGPTTGDLYTRSFFRPRVADQTTITN